MFLTKLTDIVPSDFFHNWILFSDKLRNIVVLSYLVRDLNSSVINADLLGFILGH